MLEFGASMIIDQPVYGLLRRRSVSKWSMIMLVPNSSFIIWIYSIDCPKFCFPFKPHSRTIYNHFFAFSYLMPITPRHLVGFTVDSHFAAWRWSPDTKTISLRNLVCSKLFLITFLLFHTWCQLRLDISLDSCSIPTSQQILERRTMEILAFDVKFNIKVTSYLNWFSLLF